MDAAPRTGARYRGERDEAHLTCATLAPPPLARRASCSATRQLARTRHARHASPRAGWRRGSAPAEWNPLVPCGAPRAAGPAGGWPGRGVRPAAPAAGPGPPQAHDLVTRLGAGRFGRSAVCGSEIGELGERRRGRPGAENRRELMLVTDGTMLGAKLDDRLGFPRPDSGKLLQLERIGQIDAHLGGHGSPPSPGGVPGVSLGRGSRRLAAPRRGRRTAL